jgi:hypothetical protein
MDTSKIEAALADLQVQHDIIESAIANLQSVLAMLKGESSAPSDASMATGTEGNGSRSYIDYAIVALTEAGNPLRILPLCHRISELKGTPAKRALVESSLARHISKTKNPRVIRTDRSTYGLAEWNSHGSPIQASLVPISG